LGILNIKFPANSSSIVSSLKAATYFNPWGFVAQANDYIFTFSKSELAKNKLLMIEPLRNINFPSTNVILATGNLG
jgi:hypothetical protein